MKINFDSKILQALSTAFDYMLIAFYWMICSLPVLTMGTATTAALSVILHVDAATGSVSKRFFRAFKSNFKLSFLVWLLMLLLAAVLVADIYACWGGVLEKSVPEYLKGTTVVITVIYFAVLSVIFGVIAKFKVSFAQAFYNAFLLIFKNPFMSLLLIILTAGIVMSFVCLLAFGFVPAAVFFWLAGLIFKKIIDPFLPKEAIDIEDEGES